ncbi:DDE-type integrase/transposase/recombinase [Actinomadura sp. GC306]|uniref:DDE-type integrase/transposase/recombinase n=1 Tax=Actinomadura sp. GC306 TaxID=2530367 RepID=UPI001A9E4EE5|nr:DDE-type integrase/transposase/recombinase [Actinomadura sp. GC306]
MWTQLKRELGIAGASAARKRPRTHLGGTDRPGDLLEPDFTADAPNRRWVADIIYVDTAAGWAYTAFVQDLFSRVIAGWQVVAHLGAEPDLDALEMAIWSRGGIGDGLVHHFDRGTQYTCSRYAERFDQIGAARSVGDKNDSFVTSSDSCGLGVRRAVFACVFCIPRPSRRRGRTGSPARRRSPSDRHA